MWTSNYHLRCILTRARKERQLEPEGRSVAVGRGDAHPLHSARGGGGDSGAGAGCLGVCHRALLQQVGQDPDVGALPAAVPLTPRHRQAQPSTPQRRPCTP
ncbi:hypothetical protein AVEN_212794-1, partial [Araneus ventricosus]